MQQKELAHALGITEAAVSTLKRRGMPVDTLSNAQRWRAENLDLSRSKGARLSMPRPGSAKGAEPREVTGYRATRAAREAVRLRKEELELALLEGRSLDRAETLRMLFTFVRTARDQVQNISPRICHQLAAESDPVACQRILDEEILAALNSFETPEAALLDQDDEDDDDN